MLNRPRGLVPDPLKQNTYLDLVARKAEGLPIDSSKIVKHRNDVFRLYQTLILDNRFAIPLALQNDLAAFLERLPPVSPDWENIRAAIKGLPEPEQVIAQIRTNFGVSETRK